MSHLTYVLLDKKVGETPLETLETWRKNRPELQGVPLAYAGRLDPMASGQLLVLVGEECKQQERYHHLDKEYQVEVLFGAHSDSGDVLGLITERPVPQIPHEAAVAGVLEGFIGTIELPYPVFSSKTVHGKPLHTWAVENRLHEITIPTRLSEIYKLQLQSLATHTRAAVVEQALKKIESIPPVTDPRKALGNDFRRTDVRATWHTFRDNGSLEDSFTIATISCTCSSGTYMRTLAEIIANKFATEGLAFSIHRSAIGTYDTAANSWSKLF